MEEVYAPASLGALTSSFAAGTGTGLSVVEEDSVVPPESIVVGTTKPPRQSQTPPPCCESGPSSTMLSQHQQIQADTAIYTSIANVCFFPIFAYTKTLKKSTYLEVMRDE